ncbi:hypothetical protein GCM10023191_012840 [Actinoallomurus oryzae]|uniref:Uncharacterized protein n=1 Tax=Actinoallomurus oryzae TaxID=502180 RepID=A0ABP8PI55_9ACTN
MGGIGALRGAFAHEPGILATGRREVQEAVGAIALGETVAEVGQHAVVEAGVFSYLARAYLKSMRQRTASAACRSDRSSRNCSTLTVAS